MLSKNAIKLDIHGIKCICDKTILFEKSSYIKTRFESELNKNNKIMFEELKVYDKNLIVECFLNLFNEKTQSPEPSNLIIELVLKDLLCIEETYDEEAKKLIINTISWDKLTLVDRFFLSQLYNYFPFESLKYISIENPPPQFIFAKEHDNTLFNPFEMQEDPMHMNVHLFNSLVEVENAPSKVQVQQFDSFDKFERFFNQITQNFFVDLTTFTNE